MAKTSLEEAKQSIQLAWGLVSSKPTIKNLNGAMANCQLATRKLEQAINEMTG